MLVDFDGSAGAELKPRVLRKRGIGHDAYGKHHHIAGDRIMLGGENAHGTAYGAAILLDAFDMSVQEKPDACIAQTVMDDSRHIGIDGLHNLGAALDDGHLHAEVAQVFGRFQADEAGSDDHSASHTLGIDEIA